MGKKYKAKKQELVTSKGKNSLHLLHHVSVTSEPCFEEGQSTLSHERENNTERTNPHKFWLPVPDGSQTQKSFQMIK